MKQRIDFGDDYISISDKQGEIVYWDINEWIQEPQVVFSIVNAVKMALSGIDLRRKLKKFRKE